jgi:DNA-binding transcriptional LysR family regulator
MELQQLRYVIAVSETANFTRAAEQCHVVQSALSHQIAALERELGFTLFARTSRRVQLTSAGEAFLPAARQCVEAAERAVADAAAAVGEVRGRLAVGVIPTVTGIDVPAVLRRFRKAHPQVHVVLTVAGSDELAERVRSGQVDIAVLGLPESDQPRGVASRVLQRDKLVAVVPAAHALGGRRRVGLEHLSKENFVDFPAGTPGRIQSDRAFAAAGLAREVAFEAMSTDLMLELVRQGMAITLLPSAIAPVADPRLRTVAITSGPTRTVHLAWSAFNPRPAATAFIASIPHRDPAA